MDDWYSCLHVNIQLQRITSHVMLLGHGQLKFKLESQTPGVRRVTECCKETCDKKPTILWLLLLISLL